MEPGEGISRGIESLLTWLLTKGRHGFLAAVILLSAGFAPFAFRVPVERNDDSMVSRGEAEQRADSEFRRNFGGEETLLTVTHPRLLEPEGLRLVDRLTEQAGALEGVSRVYSLTNAKQVVAGPAGAETAPLVPRPFDRPGNRDRILSALSDNPRISSLLVSPDRHTAAITIETGDRPGDRPSRDHVIPALRLIIARNAGEAELHLSGIGVQKHDVAEFIRRDKAVLVPLSVLVLMVLLGVAFRRISGVLIPMAVKGTSLVWTMGIYALAGFSLNPITALLPPLIIVLSISTSVHLYSEWLDLSGTPEDRIRLIVRETRTLFAPCLYTALATAIGLLSLLASDTPAVRQFGVFGALGVLISFAASITLVPLALSFLPLPGQGHPAPAAGPSPGILQGAARLAGGHPSWIMAAALLLAAAGVVGIARIRNNTDLVRFLKTGAPLYRDTIFIDRNLGGVYSLEMLLSRKDGSPLTTPGDIRRIAAFQEMAARQEHVADVYSVADPIRLVSRAETGGKSQGLPESEDDLLYDFDLMQADREQSFLGKLMTKDLTTARISVRIHAVGTAAAAPLIRTIEEKGKELFGDSYSLVPTGSFHQITRDSNRLVRRQVMSLTLCLAVILLAVRLLFRSTRLALLALFPTLVPILLAGGLMGFLGIDLSTGTAMIFPVALGLIVDNTIHYVSRYLRERGGDVREAIGRTNAGAGRPIAASSLILAFGFSVGAFGSFKPTIHFSLLTGVTMLASLACVLLLLPSGLVLADHARRAKHPVKTGAAAVFAVVVLVGCAATAAATPAAHAARLFDDTRDTIVRNAFVPSEDQQQGEVRLLRRGGAAVMQTVLYTRVLKRVVAEIRKKELANWPPDREGYDDSQKYINAILEARNRIQERFPERRNRGERRQTMLIEFILSNDASLVAIAEPKLEEANGHMRIVSRRPIAVLELSRTYVRGDIYEIARDALKLGRKESKDLLEPLLPPESAAKARTSGDEGRQGGVR